MLWPCQKHAASPLQSYGPRNGTSHSARNSCLSDQSPAHENASRQAVYGPGVAAQVNSFLTCVLWAFPNARWDPFALERKEKMLATHGTIDSARSSRAHHRPLIDLNDHDECCIGPKWRVHAHTPRVHGLTTRTHARRRAGHPLAGGRIGKQNAVRTILGRLVSSSRKKLSILEDAVRQAYSPDSL